MKFSVDTKLISGKQSKGYWKHPDAVTGCDDKLTVYTVYEKEIQYRKTAMSFIVNIEVKVRSAINMRERNICSLLISVLFGF